MLAAFALGAEGVQCGTRFLTVEECSVHEAWKEKVLKAKDSDTIVTGRGTGHPVRGLKNKFARECRKIEMAATSGEELEGMYAGSLARAVAGDVENGSVMAGPGGRAGDRARHGGRASLPIWCARPRPWPAAPWASWPS